MSEATTSNIVSCSDMAVGQNYFIVTPRATQQESLVPCVILWGSVFQHEFQQFWYPKKKWSSKTLGDCSLLAVSQPWTLDASISQASAVPPGPKGSPLSTTASWAWSIYTCTAWSSAVEWTETAELGTARRSNSRVFCCMNKPPPILPLAADVAQVLNIPWIPCLLAHPITAWLQI